MFRKLTTTLTPFGLTIVMLAGLTLVGRIPIADRVILGYVTIFVGAMLAVAWVADQMKEDKSKSSKRKAD